MGICQNLIYNPLIDVHPPWRQRLSLKLITVICEQTRYLMCFDIMWKALTRRACHSRNAEAFLKQEEQYYNKNDTSSLL
jgi:hypothetical protein